MKKKKPKKPKKPKLSTLKNKAWTFFSRYIRASAEREQELTQCVTCKYWYHWKELQAGHFIDGRSNSILFEENGVHPQCYACNICLKGNKVEYFTWMMEKYGIDEINRLRSLKHTIKIMKIDDYQNLITEYEEKVKALDA